MSNSEQASKRQLELQRLQLDIDAKKRANGWQGTVQRNASVLVMVLTLLATCTSTWLAVSVARNDRAMQIVQFHELKAERSETEDEVKELKAEIASRQSELEAILDQIKKLHDSVQTEEQRLRLLQPVATPVSTDVQVDVHVTKTRFGYYEIAVSTTPAGATLTAGFMADNAIVFPGGTPEIPQDRLLENGIPQTAPASFQCRYGEVWICADFGMRKEWRLVWLPNP